MNVINADYILNKVQQARNEGYFIEYNRTSGQMFHNLHGERSRVNNASDIRIIAYSLFNSLQIPDNGKLTTEDLVCYLLYFVN